MSVARCSCCVLWLRTMTLLTATLLTVMFCVTPGWSADPAPQRFRRQALTETYYSEGANAGDLNHDGHPDIVSGPYWYQGPEFRDKHEIYPAKPQPTDFYADNFFSWVYDFNQDGWNDVFVVGFPGTPAFVYENPREQAGHWPRHTVFEAVSNESPHFVDVVGDAAPELVCTFGGMYGFATFDPARPFETWKFHPVSDKSAPERFGHGLGVGDLNGDGRPDLLAANGWWEQPAAAPLTSRWAFHDNSFTTAYGGAEMLVYDVDGDGDNDVITSLAAHDYGLAWYQQDRIGDQIIFRLNLIMDRTPAQNRYGVVFTELHSLALADINGDGLQDVVTGKTYWSHHKSSPLWDAGAVVYWFELQRTAEGVDWIPHLADDQAGIGRQVIVTDVNRDRLPDIVVGGMKGAHVLLHQKMAANGAMPDPKPQYPLQSLLKLGPAGPRQGDTSDVAGAIEAESLSDVKPSAGRVIVQEMAGFPRDRWSGHQQLFWQGAAPGDELRLTFTVPTAGTYNLAAVWTLAADYGAVTLTLDGTPLGRPFDLFNAPDVITSGEQRLGQRALEQGSHTLTITLQNPNPAAKPAHLVGLDYLRLIPVEAPQAE